MFQPVLDFILDNAENDERPYLEVEILGRSILGLLDSGASATILGIRGWKMVKDFVELDISQKISCTVANGEVCQSMGECEVPVSLRGRVKLIRVLVVPDVPHTLILGANFWREMGVVPDLRHNEWHFSSETCYLGAVEHLRSQTVLTPLEEARLKAVVDRNIELMGGKLGCTQMAEHVIVTNSPPIKQRPEMKYLGYVVDTNGLHVDPDKVKAMLQLPIPGNVKDVRRLIGTFSWYRRFIPEFATVLSPITALLKKSRKFVWSLGCDESFKKMKECLISAPVLSCPDYSLPFVLQTDASAFGLGAVLSQTRGDEDMVICYLSRSLTKQERNFSTTERECLAVLWAVEKLRPYLEGIPFTVITDHYSLVWLQNLKDPAGRLARWAVRMQQYDFKIIHRKGKDHVVPDALSRSVPVIDSINGQTEEEEVQDKWYLRVRDKVVKNPKKYPSWRYSLGKLYKHVKPAFPELGETTDAWKLVVPKEQRKRVLTEVHERATSGHQGVYKTFHRIAEKYYWPKLRSDVAKFVRNCQLCKAYKPDLRRPNGLMTSQPRVNRPWEMISTDLMGPLPRSTKGNKFILVITDYFSKYSLVFPLRSSTADVVVRKIEEEAFLVYGVPRLLLCDNGPQYRSRRMRKLAEEYKLACAMRTGKHESTSHTPYFVNFGRSMVLSGEDFDKKNIFEDTSTEDSRPEGFGKLFEDIRKRLDAAAAKNEKTYNLRRRCEEFLPNQLVWRKSFVLSDASKYYTSKLAPKYVGPFHIKKRVSPWSYELGDDAGNSKGIWNAKNLKSASADENLPGVANFHSGVKPIGAEATEGWLLQRDGYRGMAATEGWLRDGNFGNRDKCELIYLERGDCA
ncbi:hypothetical protein JTB14_032478 [Gonioctena quinquepunctata]|nr:hypothetical protein JTB14_032478 [Gonioctena quinquepunctata]